MTRRATNDWFIPPEQRDGLCDQCRNRDMPATWKVGRMPTYRSFEEVPRWLMPGTYIRIEGNEEPYYDGVYRIRYYQGACAGKRIFPGPLEPHGVSGLRPKRMRAWPDDMPPGYRIPGYDDD